MRVDLEYVDSDASSIATIKATCPTCGDVELTSRDVRVLVCSYDQSASYSFRCGRCRLMISKPTDQKVVGILVASGVELVTWDLPAELDEAHSGPAVCWDDILEFHFLINAEGSMERAIGQLRSVSPNDLG